MLQFLKKIRILSSVLAKDCVGRTRRIVTSQSELEVCKRKGEACLEGLKCLKKNLLLHCQLGLNCCKVLFYQNTMPISPKKQFNSISTISTFWRNYENTFYN